MCVEFKLGKNCFITSTNFIPVALWQNSYNLLFLPNQQPQPGSLQMELQTFLILALN